MPRLAETRPSGRAEVADGRFEISRGSAERPDALVETDPATLATLVYGGHTLDETLRSVDLKIEGDEPAVARFLDLFPLPKPAQPTFGE